MSSLVLWCVFVFFQTVRHRDYFLPARDIADEPRHAPLRPRNGQTWASFALLLVSLVAVVGLAKVLSPTIEQAVRDAARRAALVGIAIALLVLMPESIAAIRAALADRLQTSLNLAFGSALATIGLTVPVVVGDVHRRSTSRSCSGSTPKDIALLALTFLVATIGAGSGRTNMMLRRRAAGDLRGVPVPRVRALRAADVRCAIAAPAWRTYHPRSPQRQ